jgi:hypothetical protein
MEMSSVPTRLWSPEDVIRIYEENLYLSQTEFGHRKCADFMNGNPHGNSLIWMLEIFQSAIHAGAKSSIIRDIPWEGCLITHDNYHRAAQGVTLEELKSFCGFATRRKSLTSIGFKSIYYFFKRVALVTVAAPGGSVNFDACGEFPLQPTDFLKTSLPRWSPGVIRSKHLLNTSYLLTGCRFDLKVITTAISSFLSNSSVLHSVLHVHGLENIRYYRAPDKNSMPFNISLPKLKTYVIQVPWRPSAEVLQQIQETDNIGRFNFSSCSLVSAFVILPLSRGGKAANFPNKSFVFSTFPTLDLTGLGFPVDGPFLLDDDRLHLRWKSGWGRWNTEIVSHCLPEFIC